MYTLNRDTRLTKTSIPPTIEGIGNKVIFKINNVDGNRHE